MPPFFVLLLDPANTGGLARRCCTSILSLHKLPCESYPEIEHSLNMKNVCLISIHTNAAGNGRQWMTARGWCCYTSRGQTALPPACMKQLPSTFQAISFGKTIPTEIPTGNPTSTS